MGFQFLSKSIEVKFSIKRCFNFLRILTNMYYQNELTSEKNSSHSEFKTLTIDKEENIYKNFIG